MKMKISTIIDYVSYLVKKYGEIQQIQMKNKFRVATIKKNKDGIKIIFQVIGKSTFVESTPSQILTNDAFLECFSKKDIQKITYLHAQNEKNTSEAKLKLIRQEFNLRDGKTNFVLKDNKGNVSIKTAVEIFINKKIAKELSQQEAMNISYIAGYEHSQIDPKI